MQSHWGSSTMCCFGDPQNCLGMTTSLCHQVKSRCVWGLNQTFSVQRATDSSTPRYRFSYGDYMANLNPAMPTCTIAILTTQCLVWVGLQNIFERSMTVQMVVYPYPWRISELLRADSKPDVFILDVETERDAVGTIKQIRESAASKIVLLC